MGIFEADHGWGGGGNTQYSIKRINKKFKKTKIAFKNKRNNALEIKNDNGRISGSIC